MKKIVILSAVLIMGIMASGCGQQILDRECSADEDCVTGGCSGESCHAKGAESPSFSICQWKDEYECLDMISCKCIEGKCKWGTTDDYWGCVEEKKKGE